MHTFYYTYKVYMPFVLSSFLGCLNYIIFRLPVNSVSFWDILWMKNSVDPDQLASSEASWSGSTVIFSKEFK